MKFTKTIHLESVLPNIDGTTKEQIFFKLSKEVERTSGLHHDLAFKRLMRAEKMSPSGIGNGVSLPQLQMETIKRPITIFMTLKHEIEFQSIDGLPVDMVCLLMSPKEDGTRHLQRLSRLSRVLRDTEFCSMIRAAKDSDEIYSLFEHSQREKLLAA